MSFFLTTCNWLFLSFLFLLATVAAGDEILFETDFTYLPENWYSSEFTFGTTGARLYHISLDHLSAMLHTGGSTEWEQNIFIPDGADSVRIEIDHSIQVTGGDYPTLTFKIKLGDLDTWEYLWYLYVDYEEPNYYKTLSHSVCPDWLQGGDWLGIRFRASGWPGEYGSIIEWRIAHVKVTAFGDEIVFAPNTWAGIKAAM